MAGNFLTHWAIIRYSRRILFQEVVEQLQGSVREEEILYQLSPSQLLENPSDVWSYLVCLFVCYSYIFTSWPRSVSLYTNYFVRRYDNARGRGGHPAVRALRVVLSTYMKPSVKETYKHGYMNLFQLNVLQLCPCSIINLSLWNKLL
jgi:hypothetical protein